MASDKTGFQFNGLLVILVLLALVLAGRVVYLFLADTQRFPINTVKIAATYQHISRKDLEAVLSKYVNASFFTLPANRLRTDLASLDWAKNVSVDRVWPDTLNIKLEEKKPMAIWNDNTLITSDGAALPKKNAFHDLMLPKLKGPVNEQTEVLQIYQKLSKLLARNGLQLAVIQLRDNHAWELTLTNGIQLYLGKQDLYPRLQRFCKAYTIAFEEKSEQLSSVDLRYSRGMAVQWKSETGR